jgi:hypothetical protein
MEVRGFPAKATNQGKRFLGLRLCSDNQNPQNWQTNYQESDSK